MTYISLDPISKCLRCESVLRGASGLGFGKGLRNFCIVMDKVICTADEFGSMNLAPPNAQTLY